MFIYGACVKWGFNVHSVKFPSVLIQLHSILTAQDIQKCK